MEGKVEGRFWVWVVGAWIAVLAFAIANGALREAYFIHRYGPAAGSLVSSIVLSAVVLILQGVLVRQFGIGPRDRACASIAGSWLAATLAFEFGFGRLVSHKSWEVLLAEYDLSAGHYWSLVVLSVAAGPWVMAWLLDRDKSRD